MSSEDNFSGVRSQRIPDMKTFEQIRDSIFPELEGEIDSDSDYDYGYDYDQPQSPGRGRSTADNANDSHCRPFFGPERPPHMRGNSPTTASGSADLPRPTQAAQLQAPPLAASTADNSIEDRADAGDFMLGMLREETRKFEGMSVEEAREYFTMDAVAKAFEHRRDSREVMRRFQGLSDAEVEQLKQEKVGELRDSAVEWRRG